MGMRMGMRMAVAMAMAMAMVCGCAQETAVPETPDGATEAVCHALADNRPHVAFDALPPSYQADINGLVSEAASRMDAEVWNGCLGVLRRAVTVLDTKGDLILQTRYLVNAEQKEMLRENWGRLVKTSRVILDSDFVDLEVLREGDVRQLLEESGGEVMTQLKALESETGDVAEALDAARKLGTADANVVVQDGKTATITLAIQGEEPETLTMVRVEGKWISRELADGFKEGIADMRATVSEWDFSSEKGQQTKKMLLAQIGTIDSLLMQAEAAQTVEQMDGVINGMVLGVMGAVMGSVMSN